MTTKPSKPRPKRTQVTRPSPAALPAALAKRGREAHAAKQQRLATRAQALLAHIRECQADVTANMVDIGLALVELKGEGMAEVLGRESFAEVCARDLKMSATTAQTLMALATRVPREFVTRIGTDRARALLDLADATPEDDSPETLWNATLTLPSGRTLDVADASNLDLREAAKEFRAARPEATRKRGRGFSTTPEEKADFQALFKRVKGHEGADGVRATLVAVRDRKGPKVRIELRFSQLHALGLALVATAKKG